MQAGCPTKLQLFPPDADPDNDEPELSLSFKLSAPVTEVTIGGGLSIDEVVGSYRVVLVGTDFDGTWLLTKNDNEQLVDETGDLVYDYNPKTGIATVSYENEAGSGTAEITFTSENGKIHLSCHWVYTNEGPENTYVRDYKGTKID